MLLISVTAAGCTRGFYRQQADGEVYDILGLGTRDPRWALPRYTIQVDPRSRFYDPSCPDYSPMPPDDPTAHQLMHCVDCKKGWPCWHRNGDISSVENALYSAYLPYNEQGEVVVDLDAVMQIALVNSRNYQSQLEELYLSALDVTFERFRFDTQFFGSNETFFTSQGRVRGGGRSRSILNTDTNFQARKLFSTGGEMVVGMANTLVWQFSGPNTYTTNTLLDFTLVQPLLRFGGRARVLERLTVTERTLLSNIRSMERFRRGFYVDIASGRGGGGGPNRLGGFLGGSGLEGFAGVGGGGFGRIGGATGGGGVGAGAGAGQAGGYLGLLQQQREIANLRANVSALRRSLSELEALIPQAQTPTERADAQLQADQVRQNLYDAESRLLNSVAGYQNALDDFKIDLGLPPNVPLELRDRRIDQFELLAPEMIQLQNDASPIVTRLKAPVVLGNGDAETPVGPTEAQLIDQRQTIAQAIDILAKVGQLAADDARVPPSLRIRAAAYGQRLGDLQQYQQDVYTAVESAGRVSDVLQLRRRVSEQLVDLRESLDTLTRKRDERIESLESLGQREEVRNGTLDRQPFDIGRFEARLRQWPEDYRQIAGRMAVLAEQWTAFEPELQQLQSQLVAPIEQLQHVLAPLQAAIEPLAPAIDAALAGQDSGQLAQLLANFDATLAKLVADSDPWIVPAQQHATALVAQGEALRKAIATKQAVQVAAPIVGTDPPTQVEQLSADAGQIGVLQARARLESITLQPVDLDSKIALRIAGANRLDWMNARAGLVNSWRLIEFNANALESDLDVVFNGDLNTLGDNPFRFRSPTGQLQAGLRFDAPITRLDERNRYRQSLIEYQQARRGYMRFVDDVNQGLRGTLRTVDVNQLNFELNRYSVHVAIDQVELSQLKLQKPAEANLTQQGTARGLGATTARDLVSALTDLLNAQNNFLSIWIVYEAQRMGLELDLGTMRLDERGMWIDPGSISEESLRAAGVLPPDDPCDPVTAPLREDVEDIPAPIDELPVPGGELPAPGGELLEPAAFPAPVEQRPIEIDELPPTVDAPLGPEVPGPQIQLRPANLQATAT